MLLVSVIAGSAAPGVQFAGSSQRAASGTPPGRVSHSETTTFCLRSSFCTHAAYRRPYLGLEGHESIVIIGLSWKSLVPRGMATLAGWNSVVPAATRLITMWLRRPSASTAYHRLPSRSAARAGSQHNRRSAVWPFSSLEVDGSRRETIVPGARPPFEIQAPGLNLAPGLTPAIARFGSSGLTAAYVSASEDFTVPVRLLLTPPTGSARGSASAEVPRREPAALGSGPGWGPEGPNPGGRRCWA